MEEAYQPLFGLQADAGFAKAKEATAFLTKNGKVIIRRSIPIQITVN
jgi:hypothetical protein